MDGRDKRDVRVRVYARVQEGRLVTLAKAGGGTARFITDGSYSAALSAPCPGCQIG